MQTCPDCGSRVYKLGCVNCDEEAYIAEQVAFDADYGIEDGRPALIEEVEQSQPPRE